MGMVVAERVSSSDAAGTIRVLNDASAMSPSTTHRPPPLTIETLVKQMVDRFGKALIDKDKHEAQQTSTIVKFATSPHDMTLGEEKDADTSAVKGIKKLSVANYSSSYIDGMQLAAELTKFSIEDILRRENGVAIVMRLATALCMHAALELDLDMKEIANGPMAERVAYDIGGKIMSYAALEKQTMQS